MGRRILRLRLLLALAAASLLLLPASPGVHATPPSHNASASAVPHDVDVRGPRRLLSDVLAYAEAAAPAASSTDADDPAASFSSSSDDDVPAASSTADPYADTTPASPSGDDESLLKFLERVLGPVIFFLVAFFAFGAAAVLAVLLFKLAVSAAAYLAGRCASAWRSVKEARKKATRVRPIGA